MEDNSTLAGLKPETSRKVSILTTFTILVAFFVQVADTVLTADFEPIFMAFPETVEAVCNFFMTSPGLFSLAGTLLAGVLVRYVSKKTLLVISYAVFAVTAGCGALVPDMTYMVIVRCIAGLCIGLTATLLMSIIAELYVDEKTRSFVMGATNTSSAILGIIAAIGGGILAAMNWQYPFCLYFLAVPITILIIVAIPKTPPEGKQAKDGTEAMDKEKMPYGKFIPMVAAFIAMCLLYFVSLYFIGFYVAEAIISDESASAIITGNIAAVSQAAGILAGLIFMPVYMKMKRAIPAASFLLLAAMFIVMYFVPNPWVAGVMGFIGGTAFITNTSYYFMRTSMIIPPSAMTMAMAVVSASMSIGAFGCSYLASGYMAIETSLLGVADDRLFSTLFLLIGTTFVVGTILSTIFLVRGRKDQDMELPPEGFEEAPENQ